MTCRGDCRCCEQVIPTGVGSACIDRSAPIFRRFKTLIDIFDSCAMSRFCLDILRKDTTRRPQAPEHRGDRLAALGRGTPCARNTYCRVSSFCVRQPAPGRPPTNVLPPLKKAARAIVVCCRCAWKAWKNASNASRKTSGRYAAACPPKIREMPALQPSMSENRGLPGRRRFLYSRAAALTMKPSLLPLQPRVPLRPAPRRSLPLPPLPQHLLSRRPQVSRLPVFPCLRLLPPQPLRRFPVLLPLRQTCRLRKRPLRRCRPLRRRLLLPLFPQVPRAGTPLPRETRLRLWCPWISVLPKELRPLRRPAHPTRHAPPRRPTGQRVLRRQRRTLLQWRPPHRDLRPVP
jgi:hypothetical protein